ncbi:MAG: BMP family protein [Sedimentibacter sp.]|uniref:BMP family protein n=1 Tax=Sedimentibacter sp. TaxID=1960295 RepID=UPI00315959D0
MKRFLIVLLCLAMAVLSLTGCSNSKETVQKAEAPAEETKAEEPLKVALCVSGAVNDMGWNQTAYEGLLAVKEKFGCEIAYTENLGTADIAAAFTDYAASGYDIVIGHGFEFGDPALEVASQYPETRFVITESEAAAENVASYVMKCEETAFLEGMLAASMTKTGKVGAIGPIQGASLVKIVNGFEDGAKFVNPDIEVQTAWTGSFTDTALAKEAATAMIENGVDVIKHCANECGTGAINSAKDAGIYVIGDSYDQYELAPGTILTSAIYNVPVVIETAVSDVINGEFKGEVRYLGMADGVVSLASYHEMENEIPEEVRTMINNKIEEIKSGAFKAPYDPVVRQ